MVCVVSFAFGHFPAALLFVCVCVVIPPFQFYLLCRCLYGPCICCCRLQCPTWTSSFSSPALLSIEIIHWALHKKKAPKFFFFLFDPRRWENLTEICAAAGAWTTIYELHYRFSPTRHVFMLFIWKKCACFLIILSCQWIAKWVEHRWHIYKSPLSRSSSFILLLPFFLPLLSFSYIIVYHTSTLSSP